MRVLSVCSGIGTDAVAWHPLGWEHLCFSEIEKFPSAVLKHRWPGIPNEGDFTKIGDKYRGAADLVVGGTPCQSFSVAGKRAGLDDPRGNLALEFARLAARIRPRWVVWENVPGVLSIDEGRTFGTFLGILGQLGYGFAYRVLDAQHFGVPQRRRRVFVVGHLGDWQRAAAVLFERHCLQGHHPPSRKAREGIARGVEVGPSGGRFTETHPTLDTRCKDGFIRNQLGGGVLTGGFFDQPQVCGAVSSKWAKGTGGPAGDGCYNLVTAKIAAPLTHNPYGDHESRESLLVTHSLRADGFDASEDGTGRGTPLVPTIAPCITGNYGKQPDNSDTSAGPMLVAYRTAGDGAVFEEGDLTAPLTTQTDPSAHVIAFSAGQSSKAGSLAAREEQSPTLRGAASGTNQVPAVTIAWDEELNAKEEQSGAILRGGDGGRHAGVMTKTMAVRRLTPRECERLQGLPDDYTMIPFNGKPAADGPRYKAIGNGMAMPVLRWIGERIKAVEVSLSARQANE